MKSEKKETEPIIDYLLRSLELDYSEHHKNVAQIGESKDSGRDIVAYLDEAMQTFDIFQCKRYKEPLSPSVYMSEFGKLCYYTMLGKYNKPRKYFIVASNDLLNFPTTNSEIKPFNN